MFKKNSELKTQEDRLTFWLEAQDAAQKVKGRGLIPRDEDFRLWEVSQVINPGTETRYKKCGSCTSRRLRQVQGWIERTAEGFEAAIMEKWPKKYGVSADLIADDRKAGKTWNAISEALEGRESLVLLKAALEKFAAEFGIGIDAVKKEMKAGKTVEQILERLEAEATAKAESEEANRISQKLVKTEADFDREGREAFANEATLKMNPYKDEAGIAWATGWQKARAAVMEEGAKIFEEGGERASAYPTNVRRYWFKGFDAAKEAKEKSGKAEKADEATNKGTAEKPGPEAGTGENKAGTESEGTNKTTN